jgi:hypothetical protein
MIAGVYASSSKLNPCMTFLVQSPGKPSGCVSSAGVTAEQSSVMYGVMNRLMWRTVRIYRSGGRYLESELDTSSFLSRSLTV